MKVRLRTADGWESFALDSKRMSVGSCSDEPDLHYLVPGLVDTHCHGASGFDVMRGESEQIAAALQSVGVEWFLPTTVTASWADVRAAIDAVTDFTGTAGFHLEGPYISSDAAGAQPSEHIQPPSFEQLSRELGDRLEKIKLVTLAPEIDGASDLITSLVKVGIKVSVGHSCATYDQLVLASKLGATRMTHFYNAMSPLHHRELGCVGFGLVNRPTCELIYDRVHVSRKAAELLIRSVGVERIIGISDGTMFSGPSAPKFSEMWGHQVTVHDGAVRLPSGTLCGSSSTLADVFSNLWSDFGPDVATDTCSVNPRRELNLPPATLWLIVSEDGSVQELLSGNLRYQV
ncbi:MAG: amidohydrolase family protein [Fimbriimonadales bacterium]